jgi:murein DD-endopeptidase MepM/ murein hydrolase activator NlpD
MRAETKAFLWTLLLLAVMSASIVMQAKLIGRPPHGVVMAPRAPASPKSAPAQTAFRTADPTSALIIPVAGVRRESLVDTWEATRSEGRLHKGIDIMAPEGTAVRALAAGKIVKLFYSKRGGITIYQIDETGRFIFYYAHLRDYQFGLREGDIVQQGQQIAIVGQTGNATTPHLHLEIEIAPPDGKWWRGESFDPYPSLMAGAVLTPDPAALAE